MSNIPTMDLTTTQMELPPWLEGPYCEGSRMSLRRKKVLAQMDYLKLPSQPATACYPTGIVHNYSRGALEELGFVPCYFGHYSDKTDYTEIMENCPPFVGDASYNMPLFFGACDSSDCDTIYVGSFSNDNRLLVYLADFAQGGDFSTLENKETVWYAVKRLSRKFNFGANPFVSWLGFAPNPTVDFAEENCDTFDPMNDDRLCWMMDHSHGGYRAGNHVDLGSSKNWYKVLFYSNQSTNIYSECGYETAPISLNDVGKMKIGSKRTAALGGVTSFPVLALLALSGVALSLLVLVCWKYKNKMTFKKAAQWIASANNVTVSQLVTEEYKPLLVTTEQEKV